MTPSSCPSATVARRTAIERKRQLHGIADQRSFGDFDLQPLGSQAVGYNGLCEVIEQRIRCQLCGGNVDRYI